MFYPIGKTVDYGYASPKIYNYTFHAGSTCAYPDANITINDDIIVEQNEEFEITIINAALPFGVQAGQPSTIIINDNDSELYIYEIVKSLLPVLYRKYSMGHEAEMADIA